ncbi:MAG: acyl-CoA reductase [Herbinix sp.]|jgi:hypothetical protein|nr:acyl-CoA reductase [Herbinix sp.]
MILINGVMLDSQKINTVLPTLEKQICRTLQKPLLSPLLVIEACDKLAQLVERGTYSDLIDQLCLESQVSPEQVTQVIRMFRKESLLYKLKTELGSNYDKVQSGTPLYEKHPIHKRIMPLGVLFHIAAGNVDGLPVYSVIEGLLAGNINILKLPAVDQSFSLLLLTELIRLEPILAEYIYVFDTLSNDIAAMQRMAKCADAIVVWGGDTATLSVRRLATPNTRIIEWGHKMSFAYITEKGLTEEALAGLAHHMLSTKQLLCSSCQGIFIDTDRITAVHQFCERFLSILDHASENYPPITIGMQAQLTLLLYNQELTARADNKRIYKGKRCNITASADQKLEVSFAHGNCWVKALPRENILSRLHRYKGYLQTVGLLCGNDEWEVLSERLLRAGATRITPVGDMSRMLCGETHDGDYPLRRYTKIVEY